MSTRTWFFPPAPDRIPLDKLPDSQWLALLRQLNDLSRVWCPICQAFVKKDEIHMIDGQVCHKIMNLAVP